MNLKKMLLITLSALLSSSIVIASNSDNFASLSNLIVSNSVQVRSSTELSTKLEFNLDELQHETVAVQGVEYDRFYIEGARNIGPLGWPELPRITQFILIPPTSGVELIVTEHVTHIEGKANVMPQQAIPADGDDLNISYQTIRADDVLYIDDDATDHTGFWPSEVAEMESPVIFRGQRILPIRINPVRLNMTTGEIEVTDRINVELNYNTDLNKINTVRNPHRKITSFETNKILRSMVLNPPELRRDEMRSGAIAYVVNPDWDEVIEGLEGLIEWRRRMGWTVDLIEVEDTNDKEDVKDAIQDAYDNWDIPPEYVVLVGDAPHRGGNNHTIAYWNHQVGAAYPYESDHDYIELDGDDIIPDAAIGRLMLDSADDDFILKHVEKIVEYESAPYLGEDDERGWQLRAAVASTDPRSGESSKDVCRWFKNLLLRHDYDEVDELYFQGGAANPYNFINTNFDAGINFFLYRGWTEMNGYDQPNVNNLNHPGMYPFIILATCNTGDYGEHVYDQYASHAERFSYDENGGAIGAIGAAGATHTAYNNLLAAQSMGAPFIHDISHTGWMLMKAKVDLWSHYALYDDIDHEENRNSEAWWTEYYIFNLMGDPAVNLFTEVPKDIEAIHPDKIRVGESSFSVLIADDDDNPVSDALVCLYKQDEFQLTAYSDAEGSAYFSLDPELTADGTIMLTVTGRNLMPYLMDFEVTSDEDFVGASSYTIDDDDDDIANPNDNILLSIDLTNFGSNDIEGNVSAALSTMHPLLEVIDGEVELDTSISSGETISLEFEVVILPGFNDGEMAVFDLETTFGDDSWMSSVALPVEAPAFAIEALDWTNGPLKRADNADLELTIRNIGSIASGQLTGYLTSFTKTISASVDGIQFDEVRPDETTTSEDDYLIAAKWNHIGGQRGDLVLVLEDEFGLVDSVFFSVWASPAEINEPFGPDRYGYICYDSNDDAEWFVRPEYNWIELSDSLGEDTGLEDEGSAQQGQEDDKSMRVDLPFEFTYYGKTFNSVTICTNGWMAMGDHRTINTSRNRKMPGAEVVSGMIAPFWDELGTNDESAILYTPEAYEGMFIVQWNKMENWVVNGDPEETFQVILLDPDVYPTFSGDGEIIFQYKTIDDEGVTNQRTWDVPHASIGIASPDQSDGLTYLYWEELTPGASPLEEGLAIKFSTMIDFDFGFIDGHVYDDATGDGVEGVTVSGSYGAYATTDDEGYFVMEVLANAPTPYTLIASKIGYNDAIVDSLEVFPEDTTNVDFYLLHPEFDLQIENHEIVYNIHPGDTLDYGYILSNQGNGTLWFDSYYDYVLDGENRFGRDQEDEIWDDLLYWNGTDVLMSAIDSIWKDDSRWETEYEGDNTLQGITYADTMWVVAGNNNNNRSNVRYFYFFNDDGTFKDTLRQPVTPGRYGIYDIEFYNGDIWATKNDTAIYQIDLSDGSLLNTYSFPAEVSLDRVRNLTIDPTTGNIWTSELDTDIYEFSVSEDSNVLILENSYPVPDPRTEGLQDIPTYGLSWYRDEPEGYNLFLSSNVDPFDNDANLTVFFKMNPQSGDIKLLTDHLAIEDELGRDLETKNGMSITPKWNNAVWVLASVIQATDPDDPTFSVDYLAILELGPNASWLQYSPQKDTVYAGEDQVIYFKFNAEDYDDGEDFRVLIVFEHNAAINSNYLADTIAVTMHVNVDVEDDFKSALPVKFSLDQNYPNPFNSRTTLSYTIPEYSDVKLQLFDISGRLVTTLYDGKMNAGQYRASFDATSLPNGVYVYRLEAGTHSASRKMVLMK